MTRVLGENITHTEQIPTGDVEPMRFKHIDTSIVNQVFRVLDRIKMPEFAQWKARPSSERVMFGEFDSPKRFLMAMAKAGVTKNQLPAVYVTREPGIAFADQSTGSYDWTNVDCVNNENHEPVALIDSSVASFTYVVTFVGWNDADIEPLVALYLMWLRRDNPDKLLEIKTKLADAEIITGGKFSDGPLAAAVPASAPYEETKLRSMSVTATVEVDYLQARYVTNRTITTDFALSVVGSG